MEVDLIRDEFADSTVPDYILQNLATELTGEWQTLAGYLDISDGDLHNIKADNSGCMQNAKKCMLGHWSKSNGTGATYRVLAKALDKACRKDLREYVESQGKEKDLIKYLKLAYRKHYETAKPFPSMSKCRVDRIFVEGIYCSAHEGDSMQKHDVLESLKSYNDILSSPKTQSKRTIIEGDPGYGKSTLTLQYLYDWCNKNPTSPLKDVKILIYLQLRQLAGVKSIYTAIKDSIVPKDEDMNEACIQEILRVYKKSVVMIFDSYDEYPDKNETESDITSIIEMKMFPDILVIILTRTLNLPRNLHPETKRIRLLGFGVAERRNYFLKAVANDVQLADRIEQELQRNPFLRDLCQVPLFSTMVAHIAHERQEIKIFSTVTIFLTYVIKCLHNHMNNKKGANAEMPAFETELAKLYSIAFSGFTRRNQQLSWEKTYLVSELGQEFYDYYINLGMLAQKRVFDNSQCRRKTEVRIWHKIFCEFYASHHLVWILCKGVSSAASSINVKETLNSINPLDHQYVYRFACGLNKSAADIIIKHLQETREGRQCAILCMLEQEEKSDQFLQSVKDLVSCTIIIHSDDAKLLQMSTIQVLEVASAYQIPISSVFLRDCSPRVDESGLNLVLQSGLALSILSSLQKLVISDIDRRQTNEECAAILFYSSQCTRLKELSLVSYNLPNTIPVGSIPSSLKARNVKVWNDKARDISHLNLQTGRWQTSDDDNDEQDEETFDVTTSNYNQPTEGRPTPDTSDDDNDEQDEKTFDVTTSNYNQPTEGRPTPDLNYPWLKGTLTVLLSKNDCHQLARHVALPKYQLDAIINSDSSAKDLLDVLEERGVIHPFNVSRLLEAIKILKINQTALFMLERYQRSRDQVLSKSLRVMLMINKEGGRLDIPYTGVSLEIPSGALEREQFIQMIIIPDHLESESLSFASNSSLVVELLPSNLNLLKPAILTLPHCLVLKKGCEWKAKIYRSHQKEGSEPQWEEQSNTHYKLGKHNCVIEIQRFSRETFVVPDKIVEAKNIIVFAAGRRGLTDSMLLDIGYYWNIASCEKVSELNNSKLLHKKPTVFYNDGEHLKISLKEFTPMNWTCSRGGKKTQTISFDEVAIAPWSFRTFVLHKTEPKGTDACICYCKAGQAPHLCDLVFQLKAPDPSSVKQPSTSKRQEDERVGTSTAGIEAPDLVVTTDTIKDLHDKFCREWKTVGRKLGIGEPKLQTIDTDNRPAQENVYQMLLTWKQSNGNEATYRLLGKALQSVGRTDLREYLYLQGGHHSEQRHGDNLQEGMRSVEEPIHQDERPSEVERTPRELHVGSDGLSTSSDFGDQQIQIKHKYEDRERSSSKYHLEQKQKDVEDREKKRVSRKRKRAKNKHHKEKRKNVSSQRKRAKQYQLDNIEKEHQSEEDKGQASWRQEKEHQSTDEEDKTIQS